MANIKFVPGLISIRELYSEEFVRWLREFMNTGALPLGPAHLLSKPNDFMVAPFTNGAHVTLMDANRKVNTFHNSCPHRRKTLFTIPERDGDTWEVEALTGSIPDVKVCSGHSWSFTSDGERALSSPGCRGMLPSGLTRDIGGILWTGVESELDRVAEIFKLPLMRKLEVNSFVPDGYRLHKVKVDRAAYRPVTGLKVYGDVDHVDDEYHSGTLKQVADAGGLEIDVTAPSNSVSVQVVPWKKDCDRNRTSLTWRRWHEEAQKLQAESPHDKSFERIVWLQESRSGWTGEQFPGMYVDSRFAPDPDGSGTMNIVGFYFHENVLAFRDASNDTEENGDIVYWAIRAYWEGLAPEDARLCTEEDVGCLNLITHGRGDEMDGLYGDHEEGVSHQYEQWLASHWKKHLRELGKKKAEIILTLVRSTNEVRLR